MNITEIRQKYPQYDDLSDHDLATALHQKSYSDLPFDDFAGRIGLDASHSASQNASVSSVADQFGQGANDVIAKFAGLPVDAMESVLNLGIEGFNKLSGGQVPQINNSVGGSDQLRSLLPDTPPNNTAEEVARLGGGVVPALATGGGALTQLPRAASAGSRIMQGAGVGAAEGTILSESETAQGQIADAAIGAGLGSGAGSINAFMRRKDSLKKILETNPDSRVAKYTLNGSGKVKDDPQALEAIKQGFDEGTISTIKGSSSTDKSKMLEMVDLLERGKTNPRFSALNRPSDVVGRSVLQRFKVVNKANRESANKLDSVAQSLRGKQVNVSDAVDGFLTDLDDLGIKINGKTLKPDYSNSDVEGLKQPQAIFNRIIGRMKNTKIPDAHDVHRLKRFIDQQVAFGKNKSGLTGRAEMVLKSLRRNLDKSLDDTFEEYNQVNTIYSQTRSALDDFQSVAGSKMDLTGDNANKAIGTLSRRILSNAQSRASVLDTFQNLQDVAIRNGGKFDDDLVTQTLFVDDLDRTFGSSAKTSFAGDIEKSVNTAARLRNSQGLFDYAVGTAARGAERLRGINEENAIKSLRELLAN